MSARGRVGRRAALALAAAFAFGAHAAEPQQPARVVRIGLLGPPAAQQPDPVEQAFMQALRELGWVEGRTIVVERRFADGGTDRLAAMAAELARMKLDLIIAAGQPAREAARKATATIPILTLSGSDPVREGWAQSLARPGGNVTGLTNLSGRLAVKQLELLKEAVPKVRRIAILYEHATPANVVQLKEVEAAAATLKLTARAWEVRAADEFEKLFAALNKERPDGLHVLGSPLINDNRKRIAGMALKSRLPSVYERREAVDAGGLLSYGADPTENYRRVAWYIDKVLKGAKPADLPVEQPTKFQLAINLKTAKQIGVTIPQSVLYKADRVIK
jgi:putative ABC transport system substrate-binding protein